MNRKIGIIGTLLSVMTMIAVMAVVPAGADPVNASATVNSNTSYAPSDSAGSSAATGGNITQIDLSVSTSTSKWQGYYGNVSGGITLANSDNSKKMYAWTNSISGEVFATQDANMNTSEWTGLTNRTGANIDTNFSLGSASDNATNTFVNESSIITVAGTPYGGIGNSSVMTYNNTNIPTWETIALANSTSPAEGNYVFVGVISDNGEAYNGENADFQMIVPVNGSTTYYFYIELNP